MSRTDPNLPNLPHAARRHGRVHRGSVRLERPRLRAVVNFTAEAAGDRWRHEDSGRLMIETRNQFLGLCVAITVGALAVPHFASAQFATLERGSGAKITSCAVVVFAPNVKPDDLEVNYVKHNSVRIAVKGTGDYILCPGFYAPARRNLAHSSTLRFSDGTVWKFDDLDKRGNLRAQAVSALPVQREVPPAGKPITLPSVQHGSWRLTGLVDGKPAEVDHCGDPLDGFSRTVTEAQQQSNGESGCVARVLTSTAQNFNMTVDCPVDWVSEDGSKMTLKGRSELTIAARSPQSFTYTLTKLIGNRRVTMQGARTGACG